MGILNKIMKALGNPKVQKYILIAVVIIILIIVFKKVFQVGALNTAFVTAQAGSNLTSQRRFELDAVADALYVSMDGPGTFYNDFQTQMKKIKTDDEFIYVKASFGEREGSGLTEWIGSEWQITQDNIDTINNYWSTFGMTSKI